ncbi:MAG: OmpA family protein, partial [Pseudomonadota bacterium]
TPLLQELLTIVNGSMGKFQNPLKIVGHTDNLQYRDDAVYNNWDLSVDRANAARRLLIGAGLPYARIQEVSGKAYTQPLIEENPAAPQNRRISITILTQ